MTKHILILALLLSCFTILPAQQYLFDAQQITTDDGLANLLTTSVYKDKKGFIWLGTQFGLNRYDGYTFRHYTKEENGLYSNDRIRKIIEDEQGNLWLFYTEYQTYLPSKLKIEAIDIFNPKTEKAIPFEAYFGELSPFKASEVTITVTYAPKRQLWICTNKGQVFLWHQGAFKKIFEKENTFFQYLTIDQQNNIWLAWQNKLLRINKSGKVLENLLLPNQIYGLWSGENNKIWVTTLKKSNGIKELSFWSKAKNENHLSPFPISPKGHRWEIKGRRSIFIQRDQKGYWYTNIDQDLHVSQQLYIFHNNGKRILHVNSLFENTSGTGVVNYFAGDNYFWVATPVGAIKIRATTNPFRLIQSSKGYSDCRGITEDEAGSIYFLNGLIYQWNPKREQLKEVSDNPGAYGLIYWDSLLWAGFYHGKRLGFQIDLRTNKETLFPVISKRQTYTFLEIQNPNRFLVGQDKGLAYLDLKNKKLLPFEQYNGFDTLKNCPVFHFHKNQSGLWLATESGIFLMKKDEGIIRHFNKANGDFPFDHIRHIYEDETGVFWLATKGGGIIKWQPPIEGEQTSKSQQFTTTDGLSNNYTYAIYGDDYGKLWIPSDKGLMCMDKTTYEVKTYLTRDGLPHNEFNLTAHYQAKDGTLYLGGLAA